MEDKIESESQKPIDLDTNEEEEESNITFKSLVCN